jgi:hypothetical protein
MRGWVFLALAAMLSGCGDRDGNATDLSDEEARDAVKEINRGPFQPLEPQPILESELEKLDFRSGGCVFSPAGGGHGAMALAMQEAGYMKLDGKLERFAADSGSAELLEGARTRYVGQRYLFLLGLLEEGRGRLVVEDWSKRVVFDIEGAVWCDPLKVGSE